MIEDDLDPAYLTAFSRTESFKEAAPAEYALYEERYRLSEAFTYLRLGQKYLPEELLPEAQSFLDEFSAELAALLDVAEPLQGAMLAQSEHGFEQLYQSRTGLAVGQTVAATSDCPGYRIEGIYASSPAERGSVNVGLEVREGVKGGLSKRTANKKGIARLPSASTVPSTAPSEMSLDALTSELKLIERESFHEDILTPRLLRSVSEVSAMLNAEPENELIFQEQWRRVPVKLSVYITRRSNLVVEWHSQGVEIPRENSFYRDPWLPPFNRLIQVNVEPIIHRSLRAEWEREGNAGRGWKGRMREFRVNDLLVHAVVQGLDAYLQKVAQKANVQRVSATGRAVRDTVGEGGYVFALESCSATNVGN